MEKHRSDLSTGLLDRRRAMEKGVGVGCEEANAEQEKRVRAHQGVEHDLDAGGVVGDHVSDAFHKALFHQGIVFGAPHIEQLIFQRGASAIQDKDNHWGVV